MTNITPSEKVISLIEQSKLRVQAVIIQTMYIELLEHLAESEGISWSEALEKNTLLLKEAYKQKWK